MALTKQSFGIYVTTTTQWWSPTVVRISGDASVAGELRRRKDGGVQLNFPDRLIMIANHQVRSHPLQQEDKSDNPSYTLTGYISGGRHTQIPPKCMGISTSSLKSL